MDIELTNCPICGHKPIMLFRPSAVCYKYEIYCPADKCPMGKTEIQVYAESDTDTRAPREAKAKWNRRCREVKRLLKNRRTED